MSLKILITGGAGGLGHALTPHLQNAGHSVRVMSRHPAPAQLPARVEWAQANLLTGDGLREAISEVQVIVHAASSPFRHTQQTDVEGTRRLVEVARTSHLQHFVHISIVGIEHIAYAYYQHKLAGESVVEASGLPYSIQRATQFHSLVDRILRAACAWPIGLLDTQLQFQTIDTDEVAERLSAVVAQPPAGRLPDLGGPEVLRLGEMVQTWAKAQGQLFYPIPISLPGGFGAGVRHGYNTCPNQRVGRRTWAEWLKERYHVN